MNSTEEAKNLTMTFEEGVVLVAPTVDPTDRDQWARYEPEQAITAFKDRRYVFAHDLENPPLALLELMLTAARGCTSLGPSILDAKAANLIQSELFKNGQRQGLVGGRLVHWASDQVELDELILAKILCGRGSDHRFFTQSIQLLKTYLSTINRMRHSFAPLSVQTQNERNLIPLLPNDYFVRIDEDCYYEVTAPWRRFFVLLNDLRETVRGLADQGIRDHSILCAEANHLGEKLIFPQGFVRSGRGDDPRYHYCLSSDLPPNWWSTSLASSKRVARKFVENLAIKIDAMGKRASMADLQSIMMSKFDLSANASRDVCKDAKLPNRGLLGSIPADERISLNEIRRLGE